MLSSKSLVDLEPKRQSSWNYIMQHVASGPDESIQFLEILFNEAEEAKKSSDDKKYVTLVLAATALIEAITRLSEQTLKENN